jgi:hypothetical protein
MNDTLHPSQTESGSSPPHSRWARWLFPSTTEVCFLTLAFIMLFGRPSQRFFLDGDPGWHIRAGQYMIETRSIPHHDIFSFSMPNAWWVAYEWGTEVIFAALDRHFGLNGVALFVILLLTTTYSLLYHFLRRQGFSFSLSFPLLLFIILGSSFHWLARPHVVSYLFVVVFYFLLDRNVQGKLSATKLWGLPFLMIVWVNLHAGFIAGIILLGIFLAGLLLEMVFAVPERRRLLQPPAGTLAKVSVATFAASLLNPNGVQLYAYLWRYFQTVHKLNPINELYSPSFQISFFQPFLVALIALIFLLRYSRYRTRVDEALTLAVWTALGLISLRNIPLMLLICAPIYARLLQGLHEPLRHIISSLPRLFAKLEWLFNRIEGTVAMDRNFDRRLLSSATLLLLLWIVAHQGMFWGSRVMNFRFLEDHFPVTAVESLKTHMPEGHVFNDWELGGFLIYYFYPHLKVFVDGRLDMYGEPFARQYANLIHSPEGGDGNANWREVFARYQIQWVIIRPNNALRHVLDADPRWEKRFQGELCVIFVRRD